MSNFEELKTLKIKDADLSQEEFFDVMEKRLIEHSETDEMLKKAFECDEELGYKEKLFDAIGSIYNSPTYYKRATLQLAYNQVLKNARSIARKIEYEKSLVVVDQFVGCFVGGSDWTGLTDKNDVPMKQDLIFIMKDMDENGDENIVFRVVDIFGKKPVRDWDKPLQIGSWYQVSLIENEGRNKKKYINVGAFEIIFSEGLPSLSELLNEGGKSIYEIEPSDASNYRYTVVKGQLRNIAPVPLWDDDVTKPIIQLRNRSNELLFDEDGNRVMGYPQTIVGYEHLYQKKLDGNDMLYTMYIRLKDDDYPVEDDEEEVFFEARFNNQYHAVTKVNINFVDFFDDYDDDVEPEELSELISDYLNGTEVIAVVKLTSYQKDKNNDKLTWIRSNGIYIEQR